MAACNAYPIKSKTCISSLLTDLPDIGADADGVQHNLYHKDVRLASQPTPKPALQIKPLLPVVTFQAPRL